MFRLVTLLVAIQAIAAHHHGNPYYGMNPYTSDVDFHNLSWAVINADRRAQRVCDALSPHSTETYHSDHYEISVSLPTFAQEQISVKLKHRVLFIQALKYPENIFSEIRIVPDFAKGNAATWTFENSVLKINIPYAITLGTEVVKGCSSTIDESVVTIPMGEP